MTWRRTMMALLVGASATLAAAQETRTYTNKTTVQTPYGEKTVTVTGEVIRYEPGQTIVVRGPNSREVTYTIGPDATIPAEIQVGRRVTLTTEPSSDGSGPAIVTRVTTTTVNADGQMKTTTEKTETMASGTTKTRLTTVYGTVSAFEPGQSITVTRVGAEPVTYTIDQESQLPQDIAVGRKVTIRTTTVSGSPVVRRVTYMTKTQTTAKKY